MIRIKNIFSTINKSPLTPLSRVYNVNLQRRKDDAKDSLQRDKVTIDKVIEENEGIYDKIKENRSLDDYNRDNYMIRMLQRENQELQNENKILNEERNELINKNNELKEFLKQKIN